jgi:hypothetical protein
MAAARPTRAARQPRALHLRRRAEIAVATYKPAAEGEDYARAGRASGGGKLNLVADQLLRAGARFRTNSTMPPPDPAGLCHFS